MLGTLRMDVNTCIREYLDMAPEIFPVESTFGQNAVGKSIKLVWVRRDSILGRWSQRSSSQ